MPWPRSTIVAAMMIVAWSGRATADDAEATTLRLKGTTLLVTTSKGETVAELACVGRKMVTRGDRVYVACGEDGVAVVDISVPKLAHVVDRMSFRGIVVDIRVESGRVEVREEDRPVVRAARRGVIFPERVGNVVELSLGTLASGSPSGAALAAGAGAAYRFTLPFVIGVCMGHGGFVYGERNTSGKGFNPMFDGSAFVGLDTRYLELGAGVGLALPRGDGPTVAMIMGRARFGARDGLNLHAVVASMYDTRYTHTFDQWKVDVGIQIPVGSRWALLLDGGAGATRDTVQVMLGGRHRLIGDIDDRRGIWLAVSAGLLYASLQNDFDSLEYIGPAVKGAVDFRF